MKEYHQSRRVRDADALFRTPTKDQTVVPDTISPAVEGYYRLPAVWIGEAPGSESVTFLNPAVHHRVVTEKELNCGIRSRVLLDGTFLFDFSSWPPAPQIEIPGYRQPARPRSSRETDSAQRKAEEYAGIRSQVMNVHQACLATSELRIKRRSAQMGYPVSLTSTLKGLGLVIIYLVELPDEYAPRARHLT